MPSVIFGRSELDSHAETTALVKNSIILSFTGRKCEVSPYADSYESIKKVPTVTGATGYTSPISGKRLILIFNEALRLGDHMQYTLLNPNQLQLFGMLVKDDPFASDKPMRIESENRDIVLPLRTGAWNSSEVHFPKT